MRSPLYVAVATRLYRKAIDSYVEGGFVLPQKELEEIEVVFNRQFTEGLIFGEAHLTSPQKPMNRGAFLGEVEDGEIIVRRKVAVGDGVGIWSRGNISGNIIKQMSANGRAVQSAEAGEKASLGLNIDSGAQIYLTSSPRIQVKTDFAVKRLLLKLPDRKNVQVVLPKIVPRKSGGTRLLVKTYSMSEASESARAGADVVFLDIFHKEFPDPRDWHEEALLGAYVPRIMYESELAAALDLLRRKAPAAILTGNLGLMSASARFDVPVFVDYSLNTFNDLDILFFRRHGATPVISPELSLNELNQLKDKDVVILCHGDIPLVNTRIDPGTEELVDESGSRFRVRQEDSYWQILNSRPYGLFDAIDTLQRQGFSQYYIDWEGKAAYSVRLYRKLLGKETISRRARRGYTSGHLYKPVM